MSFNTSHNTVQQRAAAVLARAAVQSVELAEVSHHIVRCIAAELGHAEAGADGIDNHASLRDGQEFAGEVVNREVLNQLGKGVAVSYLVSSWNLG